MHAAAADFDRELWADPRALIGLRHQFDEWLTTTSVSRASQDGLPDEKREDIVLAAYEALANSVEHAYDPAAGGGPVRLSARWSGSALLVEVTDRGSWKEQDTSQTWRGRGRKLIDDLSDTSHTRCTDQGTTVTMTWQLRR